MPSAIFRDRIARLRELAPEHFPRAGVDQLIDREPRQRRQLLCTTRCQDLTWRGKQFPELRRIIHLASDRGEGGTLVCGVRFPQGGHELVDSLIHLFQHGVRLPFGERLSLEGIKDGIPFPLIEEVGQFRKGEPQRKTSALTPNLLCSQYIRLDERSLSDDGRG